VPGRAREVGYLVHGGGSEGAPGRWRAE
jgi:hypothetical protein